MSLGAFRENVVDVTMPIALFEAQITADDVARIHFKMNDELLGLKSGNYESLMERGSALSRSIQQANLRNNEKAKKSMEDFLHLTLANRLAELEGIIAQARAEFAEIEERLIAEFGEDYLRINSEMYLDEETLAAINALPEDERDAARWQALYDLSHDKDGNLKPGYAGVDIFEGARRKVFEARGKAEYDRLQESGVKFEATGDVNEYRSEIAQIDPVLQTAGNLIKQDSLKNEFDTQSKGQSIVIAQGLEGIDAEADQKLEGGTDTSFDFFN